MSGSPIIQDGKLVGAVTHVLVNDPTTGYGIYWVIMLARDAVSVKDPADNAILEIVLMLFLAEKKFAEGCAAKGIPHTDNSILYLILGLIGLGIVGDCMLQNDLNKLAE